MTENEKTTALIPSVGADGGQPPHNSSNQSIPHETCESNPPEENIEEMRERIRRMNDPRYLHTVSMTELYQTVYKSRPPVIDGLLYSGAYILAGAPKIGKSFLVAQLAYQNFEQKKAHLNELRRYFLEGIHKLDDVSINGWDETADGEECIDKRAPHIVSVSFTGVRSEVLLNALSDRGIYVSSGSACSSNHPALSSTLQAIGLDKKLIEGTLRFSFCENTTKEELDQALKALQELLPMLRRYTRR